MAELAFIFKWTQADIDGLTLNEYVNWRKQGRALFEKFGSRI